MFVQLPPVTTQTYIKALAWLIHTLVLFSTITETSSRKLHVSSRKLKCENGAYNYQIPMADEGEILLVRKLDNDNFMF